MHSILCTDMGCHQDYLASIIDTTKRIRNHTIYSEEEERLVLCSAIMKCADISNCVSKKKKKNPILVIDVITHT